MQNVLIENTMFWAFASLAMLGALGTVGARSIIYSALSLIVVFMSIAGIFVLNNADFLAIAQVLIYGVGLTIIILFAIMFTGDKQFPAQTNLARLVGIGLVTTYLAVALVLAVCTPVAITPGSIFAGVADRGTAPDLGLVLFRDYGLPFEVASILLLMAMIGAIVMAKKQLTEPEGKDALKLPVDTASAPTAEASELLEASKHPATTDDGTETEPQQEELAGVN